MSYQESCFGPGQQRDPAAVDEKVAFQRPAGELPEKVREREVTNQWLGKAATSISRTSVAATHM